MSNITLNKNDRLMVLAVHPDDETLGAGGLLQHAVAVGAAVRVIFFTDGENNPWPQRLLEGRWNISNRDRKRWGMRRREEAIEALSRLGVDANDAVFLGLPDRGITSLLTARSDNAVKMITGEFRWHPTVLVIPALQDTHPDHNAVAVLANLALKCLPSVEVNLLKLAYLIHGRQTFFSACYGIKLSPKQLNDKRNAILCHKTQMALGRRRFLNYAKTEETFFSVAPIEFFHSNQMLKNITLGGQLLKINMKLPWLTSCLGSLTLHMIVQNSNHHFYSKFKFKRNSRAAEIFDSSGDLISQAILRNTNNLIEAIVPMDKFPHAESIFLKIERRWGFYDLAGWDHVPLKAANAKRDVDTLAIIPCYNVEKFCEDVILQTINYVDHIIVINDGSIDKTSVVLSALEAAMPKRLTLINFPQNQGKGVALIAGFYEALDKFDFRILITLDADAQHPPSEIPNLVTTIREGNDMVIGQREFDQMPKRSRLGNTLITYILRKFYPKAPMDTQSGLRAFKKDFVSEIVRKLYGSRYETELQILLLALSQRRKIDSISIPTIYIDNNKSSTFRPIIDSMTIMSALIRWRLSHAYAIDSHS
jgi:LmbE family N-acetylglucosaminyl deacetylase